MESSNNINDIDRLLLKYSSLNYNEQKTKVNFFLNIM